MKIDTESFKKLDLLGNEAALPHVRVYQWSESTITFGYNQKVEELIDFNKYRNWKVEKRPTGGGIVFHEKGNISFSVIIPRGKLTVAKAVVQTSQKIAGYLKKVGLPIWVNQSKESKMAALCADFVSTYEITLDNKKIVGIAQRFGKNVILQQGTIFGQFPQILTRSLEKALKDD